MRVVPKKFVVKTRDWPEQKSSESTEQFFVSLLCAFEHFMEFAHYKFLILLLLLNIKSNVTIWFVKVIGQFCSEVAARLKGRSSVGLSVIISR